MSQTRDMGFHIAGTGFETGCPAAFGFVGYPVGHQGLGWMTMTRPLEKAV